MVGHKLRPGGTVQADADQPETVLQMGEACVERFYPLSGEHRSGRLDRAGDHQRYTLAALLECQPDSFCGGFQIQRILGRFEQ